MTTRNFTSSDLFLGTLPGGNYILTVDGLGATTGAYGFRLVDLATATLVMHLTADGCGLRTMAQRALMEIRIL